MIRKEELIKIGQFNKPHALAGELSFTFTDDVFDRSDCEYIVCEMDGIFVPFFIEDYRFRSETGVLMKLEGIDSAEKAKIFTKVDVYFPKAYVEVEEAMQGGKDFFLNYTVVLEEGETLGRIISIDDSTVNVLFEIQQGDDEDETILVPAVEDFVVNINEEDKIITMKLPEGLLDF